MRHNRVCRPTKRQLRVAVGRVENKRRKRRSPAIMCYDYFYGYCYALRPGVLCVKIMFVTPHYTPEPRSIRQCATRFPDKTLSQCVAATLCLCATCALMLMGIINFSRFLLHVLACSRRRAARYVFMCGGCGCVSVCGVCICVCVWMVFCESMGGRGVSSFMFFIILSFCAMCCLCDVILILYSVTSAQFFLRRLDFRIEKYRSNNLSTLVQIEGKPLHTLPTAFFHMLLRLARTCRRIAAAATAITPSTRRAASLSSRVQIVGRSRRRRFGRRTQPTSGAFPARVRCCIGRSR